MLEHYTDWQGTAAELAQVADELLASLGQKTSSLNERLVRFYVQKKVLTPPRPEGRKALFGQRQLLELLVARELLDDGWPLAKIAAWNQEADDKALRDLIDQQRATAPEIMGRVLGGGFPETRRLVLAVNDDPLADLDLYAWLAARGAAVLRAYSTEHALTLLDRARVHVVISDLARLEGEIKNQRAGMDLARAIRARGSDVPLVIYTMDKSPQVRALAVEVGANYVTERPDDLRDWLEKMGI